MAVIPQVLNHCRHPVVKIAASLRNTAELQMQKIQVVNTPCKDSKHTKS